MNDSFPNLEVTFATSRYSVLVLAGLALNACKPPAPAPTTADTTPVAPVAANAPTDTVLQLERTVCFGFCPTYVASVTAGGQVVLQGTGRAASYRHESTVDPAAVAALLTRFDTEGFFQLDSAYVPGHPLCGLYATDNPGAQLFARLGNQVRKVNHYHGCHGARGSRPEQDRAAPLVLLLALEDAVDSLVGTAAVVESLRGQGRGKP